MINILQKKTNFIYILIVVGLIFFVILPAGSAVLAQEEMNHFSSVHSIYTSKFGIENPDGMAYSPDADSFIVFGADNIQVIRSEEEIAGKLTLAQNAENHLGVAFDKDSNSLFVLGAGNTELSKIEAKLGGLPTLSSESTRFNIKSFDLQAVGGMTFDSTTGRLFILDTNKSQILILSPHPVYGFDGVSANRDNRVHRISLQFSSQTVLRGIAFNPNDGHLYVSNPEQQKIYELTETGEQISTYDLRNLYVENPSTMLFAPSQDTTDDPNMMALYILDSGQPTKADSSLLADERNNSQKGQIVELSVQAPAALPPGTTLLPGTLVRTFATSNAAWNPSSPDPSGIDYWPLTNRLLIADSEVDEMPAYFQGKNVFLSTTSGALTSTCSTTSFTGEPTGVAINPNNNHIFFSTDFNDRIFEVSLGSDGTYCTSDDTVTSTSVSSLYNINDAEDVAYGNNTIFIAGGTSAEVYAIPLGANGVLGGDDGAMRESDTTQIMEHSLSSALRRTTDIWEKRQERERFCVPMTYRSWAVPLIYDLM
jgi:DNA-binding beta-propeller fold protein YncE